MPAAGHSTSSRGGPAAAAGCSGTGKRAGAHGGEAFMAAGVTAPEVIELWDWSLAPGDAHASEPHVAGTRELLTVIEGEVVLSVAGEKIVLHPGDAASFHGDVGHGS